VFDAGPSGVRSMRRLVTAVVVTHNSAGVIDRLLASLRTVAAGDIDGIVVVDNGSTDGTAERVRDHPGVILLVQGNTGFAHGVNRGIAAAAPDADILVLNPDVEVHPGLVDRLTSVLEDEARAAVAIPALLATDGSLSPSLRRDPTIRSTLIESIVGGSRAGRHGEAYQPSGGRRMDVDWATGAVMLLRRSVLDEVGGFDETFFLYSEETEFCMRVRDAGYRVIVDPLAVATHIGGDLQQSPHLWSLRAVNRVRLHSRRHGPIAGAVFRAAAIVFEARRSLTGNRASRAALRALLRPGLDASAGDLRDRLGGETSGQRPRSPRSAGRGWVCFAAQDWWYHNRAHSDFQLMRRVAEREPVLLVNSLTLRMPSRHTSTDVGGRLVRKARSMAKYLRRPLDDTPGFYVMSPLFVPAYGHPVGRRLNGWLVRTQVRIVCAILGIRAPTVVVTIPTAVDAVRRMHRRCLVLNRSDRYSELPEADTPIIRRLELELLRQADLVVYTSHALLAEEAHLARGRVLFLDHGVDLVRFQRGAEHPAIAQVPRPRAGFFGGLDDYTVDFQLLVAAARRLREVSFVLVGDANGDISELLAESNVHWFGQRPYEEIPAFGSGFDVGLMPWLDNEWIRNSNPIKLKEYLALGLPIVSTPFPELEHYEGFVTVASGVDAFVEAIGAELARGGNRPAQRQRVLEQSWDHTTTRLRQAVDEVSRCVG
jgi:GT2 family glycosyltransferase/glycosyltransferase involved in cell wall biosynthesis